MRKKIITTLSALAFSAALFAGLKVHAVNNNPTIELKTKAEGLSLVVDKVAGYNNSSDYSASYKKSDGVEKQIDPELIRIVDDKVRIDAVGLPKGTYSIKLSANNNIIYNLTDIDIKEDDRSGYAHHNYSSGVGAYKNDGTLKDNAVVVYVNENNKNTVTATVNGSQKTGLANIIKAAKSDNQALVVRIIGTIATPTWNEIDYRSSSTGSYTVDNTSVTKYADKFYNIDITGSNGAKLYSNIGSEMKQDALISGGYNTLQTNYEPLEGLTNKIKKSADKTSGNNTVYNFDSTFNMLDVEGIKNVTVEGIGDDAMILQWGFNWKKSSSIEVKNLTFKNYPEDACSFEDKDCLSKTSVDDFLSGNIWVHNNTFLQGKNNWDVTYEQDKHEGDGATDIKGIKNVTFSYNHYYKNHKTGLVGGNGTDHQANITFHHNWYQENQSRLPYARQANMHMYNNYYDSSTNSNMQIYDGAYAFIENCYFKNINKTFDIKKDKTSQTPAVKSVNNIYDNCNNTVSNVSRDVVVSNDNVFGSSFDNSAANFYYDETNHCSNVSVMNATEDIPTIIPKVAGAGIYNNSSFNSLDINNNLSEINLGYQAGTYESNNIQYKAVRFVGQFKLADNVSSLDIESINIIFNVYDSENNLYRTINKEIDSVYNVIKSGNVIVANEPGVKYYYAIIKGITDTFDGYKIVATAYININNRTLTVSETYTI